MKKTSFKFLLLVAAFGLVYFRVDAQCSFDKSRSIIIDNANVAGSADLVDFPVYLNLTSNELRTSANGGVVQNTNGYDIRLMQKGCDCWLDFIIHSYNGTTGSIEIYVSIPYLKTDQETLLELYYGDASISADPSTDTAYQSTRTADWITTQNNNRDSPDSFYSMGSQKEGDCSGPGGVDAMDGTSNLVLWLKADCGVKDGGGYSVLDGNQVGRWKDQSGNEVDALETTFRPDYQIDQVQGNPALNFTAANGDRILSAGVSDADEYMIFIVAEPNSYASNNIGLVHAAPSGNAFSGNTNTKSIGMWVSNTGVLWGRLIQSNGGFVNYSQTSAVPTGEYFIMTNYANGSNTTGQYIRGVDASASSSYNGTVQSWVDFGIGRQGTESWDGHIAEIIVYNRYLSDSDRGKVENYLASKYGAEIPRLSGSTGPAGIGESDGTSKLEIWFDAHDLDGDGSAEGASESGQSGGVVSEWADKSGHGYDLSTGSASFTETNAGLNDISSVDFNGSSEYLQSDFINLASNNELEYFIVFDDASSMGVANGLTMVNWEDTDRVGGFELIARTNAGRLRGRFYEGGGFTNTNMDGFATTDSYILNTSYGASGRDYIRNGTSISSDGTAITLNSPTSAPLVFGRRFSNSSSYFAADIAEFISFSVELNEAEKEIVEQYLSAKYNIAVSGTDYYSGHDASYNLQVQGIGTSDGTLSQSHVESNASGGLIIAMANGSFDVPNEYVFTGNNGTTEGTTDSNLTSIPVVEERISKVWYLDKTGTVDLQLTFNIQEAVGTSIFPAGDGYVLLYSSAVPLDFQNYTADHTINPIVGEEDISFIVPNAQLLDGYYTVGTTDASSNPLPVELIAFDAETCDNDVCLTWTTGSETNNESFSIERSTSGEVWQSVGIVSGAGNTTDLKVYHFKDNSPIKGRLYYRLKQTDFDGTYAFSKVESVMFLFQTEFEIYPNPTSHIIRVVGEDINFYNVYLHQIDGKQVPVKSVRTVNNQIQFDLQGIPAGIYFLRLEYQGITHIERVIKY